MQKRESNRVQFRVENTFATEVALFDVLLSNDLIEHIDDSADFLRNPRRLPGLKIIHIPLELSVLTVLKPNTLVGNSRRVGHIHFYSKEVAIETLIGEWFQVVDCRYTPWALDYPSRSWKAAALNGARRAVDCVNRNLAAWLFGGYSLLVLAK